MSKITFAHRNLADAGSIVASSALPNLPAAFLQDPDITKVWRSAAAAPLTLTVDLGQAALAGVVMLANCNIASSATIRVEASDAADFSSTALDTGTLGISLAARNGLAVAYFAPTSARYWRITITDPLVAYVEAGRLFLGAWRELRYNYQLKNRSITSSVSIATESYGRQTWVDRRRQRTGVAMQLWLTPDEALYFWPDLLWWCDTAIDCLITLDRDQSNPAEVSLWGLLQAPLEDVEQTYPNLLSTSFRLMERI